MDFNNLLGILKDFANLPSFWQMMGFAVATAMFMGALFDGGVKDLVMWIITLAVFVLLVETARFTYLEESGTMAQLQAAAANPIRAQVPVVMTGAIFAIYSSGMVLGYYAITLGRRYHYFQKRRLNNGLRGSD